MEVVKYRGGVALVSDKYFKDMFASFLPNQDPTILPFPLHITLLTKAEYVACGKPDLPRVSMDSLDPSYLHALGIGQQLERPDVKWIVVVWYHAERWRRSLGLEPSHLHVSVTPHNNHDLDKGLCSLSDINALADTWTEEIFDHILLTQSTQHHPAIAARMASRFPNSDKAFVRLADLHKSDLPKLSMLAYARAYSLNPSLEPYIRKQLLRFNGVVAWGPTMTELEQLSIPASLRPFLLDSQYLLSMDLCNDVLWTTPQHSREGQWLGNDKLPRFFSWSLPNRLAGMSTPRSDIDIDLLQALGITTVLTLTKEEPLPGHWFEFKSIKNVHIPIENYQAPTLAEMDYIYNQYTSDRTSVWLVHCGGGKGRAGTVLACLIAMHDQTGSEPTPYPNLDTTSAISTIRSLRPGSIESNVQETFVGQYIQHRWRIAQSDPPPDESSESMSIDSALPSSFAFHKDVTHLLLVGLPGAGKSWLSIAIAKRRKARGLKTLIINQDTTRSRSACEEAFGRDHAPALVILDRCNPSASDRAYFLSLLPTKHTIVAVHLSSSLPICEARIASRLDHPTIPIGRGTNALTSMSHDLDLPTLKESFCALITVPSFPAAHSAALLLGGEIALTKFPRTPHLLDLGAATSDDLISPVPSLPTRSPLISPAPQSIGKTIIEEKLDGANLGISLSPSGSLVTQNRSHYVSATDHAQFRPLPTWLARHDSALKQLLGRDPHLSDRWTLYGEWLVAKHSIHYSSLPDLFLAFDLYDRVEGTYVSRRLLERALKGTGIGMVPLIETREGGVGEEELRGMVQGRSRYYEGRVEGVYVRFEDAEGRRTVRRGKVVRGDFLAGDEHWSRRGVVKSGVLREGASRDDGDVGVA